MLTVELKREGAKGYQGRVTTLREASTACREYIATYSLGATGWAGRGCRDYYNAELRTAKKNHYALGGADSDTAVIAEKGKLSVKRIAGLAVLIDAFFGFPVSGMIDIHKTLIVEE
jgi:hypothetical protein